jgi:pyrroloquinoline quinone biosynthesis protein B
VRVLGTAAGGGLPQWNCACAECALARGPDGPAWRSQDGLAVEDGRGGWFLLNASPDIRAQILATPELAPGPGRRESPVRGVLLTDAELDHTLGLVALREGAALDIHATAPVLGALETGFPVKRVLAPYSGPRWHAVAADGVVQLGGTLTVTAVPLGAKRPRYAADLPERPDWVVGYRIEDRRGSTLVYAPCVARWTDALEEACDGADCLILDGTFYTDDEMTAATGGGGSALSMGHLPIAGSGGSLERLRGHPHARRLYTHLNNTNPISDPGSAARAAVEAAGVGAAADGMLLEL